MTLGLGPEVGECRECGVTVLISIAADGSVEPLEKLGACKCGSTSFGRLPFDEAMSRVGKKKDNN